MLKFNSLLIRYANSGITYMHSLLINWMDDTKEVLFLFDPKVPLVYDEQARQRVNDTAKLHSALPSGASAPLPELAKDCEPINVVIICDPTIVDAGFATRESVLEILVLDSVTASQMDIQALKSKTLSDTPLLQLKQTFKKSINIVDYVAMSGAIDGH